MLHYERNDNKSENAELKKIKNKEFRKVYGIGNGEFVANIFLFKYL